MPTRVKVCGITRLEDAQLAVELGAAALGFNFYPPSPRYIAAAAARDIIRRLPPFVMPVGVFADEVDAQHVAGVAHQAGVAAVQLHGPNYPAPAALEGALGDLLLIRAVPVGAESKVEDLRGLQANALLLDTYDPTLPGGTGKTFDWSLARAAKRYSPIILAGGLTPENVAQAIREVRPFAVDVASGVESSPGVKDQVKLRAFFRAVGEADCGP
jgi:phosphoribosylanthranilate isomerase